LPGDQFFTAHVGLFCSAFDKIRQSQHLEVSLLTQHSIGFKNGSLIAHWNERRFLMTPLTAITPALVRFSGRNTLSSKFSQQFKVGDTVVEEIMTYPAGTHDQYTPAFKVKQIKAITPHEGRTDSTGVRVFDDATPDKDRTDLVHFSDGTTALVGEFFVPDGDGEKWYELDRRAKGDGRLLNLNDEEEGNSDNIGISIEYMTTKEALHGATNVIKWRTERLQSVLKERDALQAFKDKWGTLVGELQKLFGK
jgi:hypothetical protein